VTQRVRTAYSYIDNDRVVITRPSVVLEMGAIKALRTGNASAILSSDPSHSNRTMGSHLHIHQAVDKMMHEGWVRPNEGFQAVKKKIWEKNDEAIRRMLRDL
jgi:hypothetical protein